MLHGLTHEHQVVEAAVGACAQAADFTAVVGVLDAAEEDGEEGGAVGQHFNPHLPPNSGLPIFSVRKCGVHPYSPHGTLRIVLGRKRNPDFIFEPITIVYLFLLLRHLFFLLRLYAHLFVLLLVDVGARRVLSLFCGH